MRWCREKEEREEGSGEVDEGGIKTHPHTLTHTHTHTLGRSNTHTHTQIRSHTLQHTLNVSWLPFARLHLSIKTEMVVSQPVCVCVCVCVCLRERSTKQGRFWVYFIYTLAVYF